MPGCHRSAKSHAHKKLSREAPHGADLHVFGEPHGEPGAPHGAGRRSDMAEEDAKPTESAGTEPQGEEPDYKALYEAEKAHSRKWEKQAKANRTAADELAKAQEAGKTAEEQIADLKKRLDEKEKAEQRAKLAAKVAEKKGIPADLIVGDDEDSMNEWADKMLKHFQKKPAPKVEKPGKFDRGDGKDDSEMRGFARQLLGKE